MDSFFASPDSQICRSFREACSGSGAAILRRPAGGDPVREFALAVASGLTAPPRRLASRFLYDEEGSALFDRITELPEYYLTRTEASILAACAPRICALTGPVPLLELGSGSSLKTDLLLKAWLERTPTPCYVPVDVSESALFGACRTISVRHPQVKVVGVNCEYEEAFPLCSQLGQALVLFLGSSLGNFAPAEMSRFLSLLAGSLEPGDHFLLGVDLVKEEGIIEAAYNDAQGVTAQFTRNLFARMNRELGCAIDTGAIEHLARYHAGREQVETFARFLKEQTVYLAPLDRQLTIPQGELVQIEISRKFRLDTFLPYLERFGFTTEEVFCDERNWFALLLLRRSPRYLGRSGR